MTTACVKKECNSAVREGISNQQIRDVFKDALKHAFEETKIAPRDFTWFSNKPLHRH